MLLQGIGPMRLLRDGDYDFVKARCGETDPAAPAPKSLSKLSLGQGNWAVQAGLKRLGMCEKHCAEDLGSTRS